MKLSELKKFLSEHPDRAVRFILPTGTKVPPHAHVTEIARIDKRYVDCGGTFRTDSLCRMQAWFQDDTDHRLTAGKLLSILNKAASFLETEDIDVEVEYEAPFISQFPVSKAEANGDAVVLQLSTKHTACLAEDRCLPPKAVPFKPLPTFSTSKCC